MLLMAIIAGDYETDGKAPFYAIYDADMFIDKNMEVSVALSDVYRYTDVSKQDLEYNTKS